jgi:predicted dehydrogenase
MSSTDLTSDKTVQLIGEKRLSGKVCLIAGASGTIDCAVGKHFQQEGAKLALTHFSQKPKRVSSDLVVVSTPTEFHTEAIILALKAGKHAL